MTSHLVHELGFAKRMKILLSSAFSVFALQLTCTSVVVRVNPISIRAQGTADGVTNSIKKSSQESPEFKESPGASTSSHGGSLSTGAEDSRRSGPTVHVTHTHQADNAASTTSDGSLNDSDAWYASPEGKTCSSPTTPQPNVGSTAGETDQQGRKGITERLSEIDFRTTSIPTYGHLQSGSRVQSHAANLNSTASDRAPPSTDKNTMDVSNFSNETITTKVKGADIVSTTLSTQVDSSVAEGSNDVTSKFEDMDTSNFTCKTTKTMGKYADTISTTPSTMVNSLVAEGSGVTSKSDDSGVSSFSNETFIIKAKDADIISTSPSTQVNSLVAEVSDDVKYEDEKKDGISIKDDEDDSNKVPIRQPSEELPVNSPEMESHYENNTQTADPFACRTAHVERDRSPKSKNHVSEGVERITISKRNRKKAQKLTQVTPLKGNVSSNAGFVMVNQKYGARLFFWFVKSQKDPQNAPLIVWLQGQPGWSSLYGMFEEHGPYRVEEAEDGIRFELREFAWTNEFNVLYLDHCVGCGYSIASQKIAYKSTYEMVGKNVYFALEQFFHVFTEYAQNDLYLAGEHGCAKYIPVIAHAIHSNNGIREFKINLKGMLIGGPYVDSISMASYSAYLHMIGLIDESEQENLHILEQYAQAMIRASKFEKAIAFLKEILYSKFEKAGYEILYDVRYEKPTQGMYRFQHYMPKVVKHEPFVASIHAEGLKFRSRSEILIQEIMEPVDDLLKEILKNYKVLYYNGQFDMLTPYSLTSSYLSNLKWSESSSFYASEFNNWYATNDIHPNGYWKYWNNLTQVLIRNAGHTVGTTKPEILLQLLKWFVNGQFEKYYALPSPDLLYGT